MDESSYDNQNQQSNMLTINFISILLMLKITMMIELKKPQNDLLMNDHKIIAMKICWKPPVLWKQTENIYIMNKWFFKEWTDIDKLKKMNTIYNEPYTNITER